MKHLILIVGLLSLSACGNFKVNIPSSVIRDELLATQTCTIMVPNTTGVVELTWTRETYGDGKTLTKCNLPNDAGISNLECTNNTPSNVMYDYHNPIASGDNFNYFNFDTSNLSPTTICKTQYL